MAPMLKSVFPTGREWSQFGAPMPPAANIFSITDLYTRDSNRVRELYDNQMFVPFP